MSHLGIVIGVDSRGTTMSRTHTTLDGYVRIWDGDNYTKFFNLVNSDAFLPSVSYTVCGNSHRIQQLRDYAFRIVNARRRHPVRDILAIMFFLNRFLMEHRFNNTTGKCEIHLAGFERTRQRFQVFHIGDDYINKEFSSDDAPITVGAIGSGSRWALDVLEGALNDLPAKGRQHVTDALMNATFYNCCTRGVLRVFKIDGPESEGNGYVRPVTLSANHAISQLILTSYRFHLSLFFFTNYSYSEFNYSTLDYSLMAGGFLPVSAREQTAFCMGRVCQDWTMFIVRFSEYMAQHFFNDRCKRLRMNIYNGTIRSITLSCPLRILKWVTNFLLLYLEFIHSYPKCIGAISSENMRHYCDFNTALAQKDI